LKPGRSKTEEYPGFRNPPSDLPGFRNPPSDLPGFRNLEGLKQKNIQIFETWKV